MVIAGMRGGLKKRRCEYQVTAGTRDYFGAGDHLRPQNLRTVIEKRDQPYETVQSQLRNLYFVMEGRNRVTGLYKDIIVGRTDMLRSQEKRDFLRPYLPEYRRVKAVAKENPRLFAQFQTRIWVLWINRWYLEMQAPDLNDAAGICHWNHCRQRDLLKIIQMLALWDPFYAEGCRKQAGQALLSLRVENIASKTQLSSMRRSDRVPKPKRHPDDS
ncbi:uncharacterized protein EV420DRAFT_1480222 [Desarmillaria tabescens]|uniref:Uncharacterized protein n=1 Tax=Armillaria tabescens TaxID=1929756 RepID=A0AA39KBF2_ARMTA|nr:uncharacterized protein EV420DRAFT_1480222 [Desarmillaria tabescens]KAK0458062.1 hypothetical protein EV420DRAFT_1480222 [Desarmillaria tabescens]